MNSHKAKYKTECHLCIRDENNDHRIGWCGCRHYWLSEHRLCLYGRMNTKQAEYKNDTACLAEQIVQREFQAQLVSAALFAVAVTVMKP